MVAVIPAVAIGAAVGAELPKFFDDAFDQLGQGGPNYLRDGNPSGIVAQIGQAIGRSACRSYGAGNSGTSGAQALQYEKACRPYLDSLEPGNGLGLATPFAGGQCDGQPYLVTLTWNDPQGTPQNQTTGFVIRGPVGAASFEDVNDRKQIRISGRSAPILSFTCRAAGSLSAQQSYLLAAPITGSTAQGLSQTVTPCGFADVCGSPPPTPIAPRPQPDPTGPSFRFNPSPNIDIPITVGIGNDGKITFDIGTGPISIDPFADPDGGGTDPGGGGGGDGTDPGDAGAPEDTGSGGAAEGEAPPGEELVGVLVEIVEAVPGANTFGRTVETVYRGVGYVRMGYPNRLGVDVSGGTVFQSQFFHAQQRGVTAWQVRANIGYNLRATPYYREI